MKLLTKNTDYAVRALLELGLGEDAYISARYISERQKIPYSYLRKILQTLIKEGLVNSKEGNSGGFCLGKAPGTIKLVDIIEVFQGPLQLSECMFRKKICPNRATCVLRANIMEIEELVIKKFANLTIGKLLNQLK